MDFCLIFPFLINFKLKIKRNKNNINKIICKKKSFEARGVREQMLVIIEKLCEANKKNG